MKKSVFTFGLLASSLVMLAVMPLFNNNNNAAMAQVYDDNYYGDDNSYSKYPTDDKKYECRTGPFEGFFVSSVEFCKHIKFDDKDRRDIRDNQTGTQGPPCPQGIQGERGFNGTQGIQGERGLTGATGATGMQGTPGEDGTDGEQGPRGFNGTDGAQGPAGITQLNDTNTYQVTSGEIVNNFTSSTNGFASCNDGDFVINGGFTITATSPSPAAVTLFENSNKPFYNPVTSGWEVFIWPTLGSGQSSGMVTYLVHATCFDNSP